jgi:hypothetical protein
MRRPLLVAALGAVMLGLSIPLALLGRAVLATPDRVEAVRVGVSAGTAVQEGRSLFDRAADGLLGAREDGPFAQLTREYARATQASGSFAGSATPLRLATLARNVRPRSERAQAHLMVGAVFALPAGDGSMTFGRMRQMGGGRLLTQATEEFRAAALLDDGNEAAKYDLELVLKSQTAPFSALSGRRQTPTKRPSGKDRHQGQDAKHPRTRRKLRQGGVYGSGSGY